MVGLPTKQTNQMKTVVDLNKKNPIGKKIGIEK